MDNQELKPEYLSILKRAQEAGVDPEIFEIVLSQYKEQNAKKGSQPGPVYDAIFHTIVERLGRLMIFLINDLFGTDYTGDEEIIHGMTEVTEKTSSGVYRTIRTDSHFTIVCADGARRTFHVECQVRDDNTILLRIVEYDLALARLNSVIENNVLRLLLPDTAVVLLRSTENSSHPWKYQIVGRDGSYVEHEVHVTALPDTSIDDMFSRRLYALLPFHLFTHTGSELKNAEHDPELWDALLKESELVRERIMNEEDITQAEKLRLLELARGAADAAIRNDKLREELKEAMYPQTIELEIDKYGDAREAEGKAEGIIEMGLEADLKPKQIVSSLSKICKMTPAAARNKYDNYMAVRAAEDTPNQS